MHNRDLQLWQHAHTFGQEAKRVGERRTLTVVVLTVATMVVEIAAGVAFGSMALLADGLHMASHATALAINAFAYLYARRHADNPDFSFGTGKVNTLGGFTGAVLLATFAAIMAWESISRVVHPTPIAIDQAIFVAVLGLVVNGVSASILTVRQQDGPPNAHRAGEHRHDHNLRSAYLHVLADVLTSVLAIGALLIAKYLGFVRADPIVGIVGALLVARWSVGLLKATSNVLLDRQGPSQVADVIRASIESDEDSRVTDLHVWSIAPGLYAAIVTVVAGSPASPDVYKARLPRDLGLAHVSVEVYRCELGEDERARGCSS